MATTQAVTRTGFTPAQGHKVASRLRTIYGPRWDRELEVVLFEEFGSRVGFEAYAEALRRHIHSEVGQHPPTIADISRHLADIKREYDAKAAEEVGRWFTEQARQDEQAGPPVKNLQVNLSLDPSAANLSRWREIGNQAQANDEAWRRARTGRICYDCRGTGISRFWWAPPEREACYTRAEYVQLPVEDQERLRVERALCDCSAGQAHPHRSLYAPEQVLYTGPRRGEVVALPIWPRMEIVRKLARRRQPHQATMLPTAAA